MLVKNFALFLLIGLISIPDSQAQFGPATPPTNADLLDAFAPYTSDIVPGNVEHTGAASCWYTSAADPSITAELRVVTWDGTEGSFNWNYDGVQETVRLQGAAMGNISDPDIVVSVNGGLVAHIVVTYELFDAVFFEGWTFNGLGVTPEGPPVNISSGDCPITSPNIDVTPACGAVVVWEECNTIRGRYIGYGGVDPAVCPVGLQPIIEFSTCAFGFQSQPDVSIFNNGVDNMINVVYINTTSGSQELILQRHPVDELVSATPVTCDPNHTFTLMTVPSATAILELPRVASPWNVVDPGVHQHDCEVVVSHRLLGPPFTEEIIGFNHTQSVHGPDVYNMQELTLPLYLSYCGKNRLPVVSYTGCDRIMVEWQYKGQCLFGGPAPMNIIATKLSQWGDFIDPTNYTAVTDNPIQSYRFPSVCGRFLDGSPLDVTSAFYNPHLPNIQYTHTTCAGLLARRAVNDEEISSVEALPTSINVYPNPANDQLIISVPVNDEQSTDIQLQDNTGKLVGRQTASGQQVIINTEHFAEGVYLLRIQSNDLIEIKKVVIHH